MNTENSQPLPKLSEGKTIAIVRSTHHDDLTQKLEDAAHDILMEAGADEIIGLTVPGAFEIPLACKRIIEQENIDGIVALGVIIQGETYHAAEVARASTDGIMQVQLATGVPITHGIIFADTMELARERSGEKCNRGAEAAKTLLFTIM